MGRAQHRSKGKEFGIRRQEYMLENTHTHDEIEAQDEFNN
jgi:hypothetical protein